MERVATEDGVYGSSVSQNVGTKEKSYRVSATYSMNMSDIK